jgi:hypothetical protein
MSRNPLDMLADVVTGGEKVEKEKSPPKKKISGRKPAPKKVTKKSPKAKPKAKTPPREPSPIFIEEEVEDIIIEPSPKKSPKKKSPKKTSTKKPKGEGFASKSVKELRDICNELGLAGCSKGKKEDLISLLNKCQGKELAKGTDCAPKRASTGKKSSEKKSSGKKSSGKKKSKKEDSDSDSGSDVECDKKVLRKCFEELTIEELAGRMKRRRNSDKKKDPNAPKRPLTSFLLYSADHRTDVRKKLSTKFEGKVLTGEVGRELGRMWKLLPKSEQKPYIDAAEKAMKKYKADK